MKAAITATKKSGRALWVEWRCHSLSLIGLGYNVDREDQLELFGVDLGGRMGCLHILCSRGIAI